MQQIKQCLHNFMEEMSESAGSVCQDCLWDDWIVVEAPSSHISLASVWGELYNHIYNSLKISARHSDPPHAENGKLCRGEKGVRLELSSIDLSLAHIFHFWQAPLPPYQNLNFKCNHSEQLSISFYLWHNQTSTN